LGDMTAAGHAPDLFTFTALINACQRANEAELAFEVLTCAGPALLPVPHLPRAALSRCFCCHAKHAHARRPCAGVSLAMGVGGPALSRVVERKRFPTTGNRQSVLSRMYTCERLTETMPSVLGYRPPRAQLQRPSLQ